MSEMSDYLEDAIVNQLFRTGTPLNSPATIAIALATATILDSTTGATMTEATGTGYDRVDRNPLDANWDATSGSDGLTANTAALTFPAAGGDWSSGSDMTDVAVTDNSTPGSGNIWLYTALDTAKDVLNGDTAEFAAGALTVTFA